LPEPAFTKVLLYLYLFLINLKVLAR